MKPTVAKGGGAAEGPHPGGLRQAQQRQRAYFECTSFIAKRENDDCLPAWFGLIWFGYV